MSLFDIVKDENWKKRLPELVVELTEIIDRDSYHILDTNVLVRGHACQIKEGTLIVPKIVLLELINLYKKHAVHLHTTSSMNVYESGFNVFNVEPENQGNNVLISPECLSSVLVDVIKNEYNAEISFKDGTRTVADYLYNIDLDALRDAAGMPVKIAINDRERTTVYETNPGSQNAVEIEINCCFNKKRKIQIKSRSDNQIDYKVAGDSEYLKIGRFDEIYVCLEIYDYWTEMMNGERGFTSTLRFTEHCDDECITERLRIQQQYFEQRLTDLNLMIESGQAYVVDFSNLTGFKETIRHYESSSQDVAIQNGKKHCGEDLNIAVHAYVLNNSVGGSVVVHSNDTDMQELMRIVDESIPVIQTGEYFI